MQSNGFSRGGCVLIPFLQLDFQFVAKKKKKEKQYKLIPTLGLVT